MAIRTGVIGLGLMGGVQVAGFQKSPDFEVVAVCDIDRARADKVAMQYGVSRVYTDPDELVRRETLDLLGIATPPDSHSALSIAALDRGWHVLCEKPTAMNAGEAEEMVRHARGAKLINVIDHELRFNPVRARMRELIRSGYVGRPTQVFLYQISGDLADTARTKWTWWSQGPRGGGLLGETGSHAIDLLRWFFGDITDARGRVHTFVTERPDADGVTRPVDTDDYTAFSLTFASGVLADVVLSGTAGHPGGRRLEVNGDAGALVLDDQERLLGYRRGSAEPEDVTVAEEIPSLINYPGDYYSPAFYRLIGRFAEAVREGGAPTPAADFEDGLAVQRTLDAVRATTVPGLVADGTSPARK